MSDSPKYSTVDLTASVLRELAAERRRKAEERRARRAAEVERRRRERLERRGAALRSEVAKLIGRLDVFSQSEAGKRVTADLHSIRSRLSKLGDGALREDGEITEAAKQLKGVRKALALTTARAEAEQLAAEVEQEQAVLLHLKRQTAASRLLSKKFDPEGLRELEALLSTVESQLKRRDLVNARQEIVRFGKCLVRHRAQVERGQSRWNELCEEAASVLAGAERRLASLQADEPVRRWAASELEALVRRAEELHDNIAAGRFDQVRRESETLLAEADRLAADAEKAQHRQDQRDYVTKSIRESLADLGFWVEEFAEEQPSAEATIQATRLDGRAITVSVPLEGSLRWAAEGFPMEVVSGSDGQPARACDEAAEQIEAIKAHLAREHGVETGELTWSGKDPHRTGKAAKRQPQSRSHESRRTFGAQP